MRDLMSTDIGKLGVAIGVMLPLLNAILYPLYYHEMTYVWQEWSRLLELPFVACELSIIMLARRRGMDAGLYARQIAERQPYAIGLMLIGLFGSSLLISKMPQISLMISLITTIHLWFGLAIYHLAREAHEDDWDRFLAWLAIGLIPLALLTAWKFNFPPARSNGPGGAIEWSAALPGFINVRHFGSWTAGIATAMVARFLFRSPDANFIWWLAGYALAAMLTIWSGTRAGVASIVIVPIAMAIVFKFRADRKRLLFVGTASALAALVAWYLRPVGLSDFMLYVDTDGGSVDSMTSGRTEMWQATFVKWLESSLLGWGSGSTFWEIRFHGWSHTQPHNFVLQFLISWGLVGALAACYFLAKGCLLLLRVGPREPELVGVLAITLSMLLLSLQEGMLHYPRFIMLSMIGFAAFYALVPQRHPGSASSDPAGARTS